MIDPGQIVYAPAAVRVAAHTQRVGDPAGGEVLRYTGTTGAVTVQISAKQQRVATPGVRVAVMLPNGKQVTGVVDRVGAAPTDDGTAAGGESKIAAIVTIADQAALKRQHGQVTVRFVVERRRNVLTVPVVALVALTEGGYGVQVADGGRTRYVAVSTGLFANGRVEIRSGALTAGTHVVVPK